MKRIILSYFLILNIQGLLAQANPDTLTLFVINNKKIVKDQIAHIRDIYYNFGNNQGTYSKKLLVCLLNNREANFLIDPDKLKYIDSETSQDWIRIYTYKTDTFCSGLDYFEYYYLDANFNLLKITCDQGDYPDGFNYGFTDYYFDNSKLIFVFSKGTSNPPIGENSKSILTEERYYYLDNRPIRCLSRNNKNCDIDIESIENNEISLSEGLPYLYNGNEMIRKLKKTKIIK